MNKHNINFGGHPIYLSQGHKPATEKELDILRKSSQKVSGSKETSILKLSEDSHLLKNKKLKNIKKILLDCFKDYVDNILQIKNKFYMCNSWSGLQKKGEFHPGHIHPNHIFSAVYYAKTQKSSLNFFLEKSRIQESFHFSYDVKKYNTYNSSSWVVVVNLGDVLIFPGHLKHQSSVCEGNERIIVGSSFFLEGKIGSQEMYNDFNLKV